MMKFSYKLVDCHRFVEELLYKVPIGRTGQNDSFASETIRCVRQIVQQQECVNLQTFEVLFSK